MAELGSGNGTDYPGVLDKNDTTVADNVDDVKADHMNDVMAAVVAVQAELGVDPAGTFSTVVDRLDDLPVKVDIQKQSHVFAVATGSSGAYAITLTPTVGSYAQGQRFIFKANHDCPASPTLNVDSLGAGNLVDHLGINLGKGDIVNNQIVEVVRRSSDFQVTSPVQKGTPTGMVSPYVGSSAPNSWILADGGTIGNAASGGTTRANADTEELFELLWNSMADAEAAVSSGRGASAQADFDANKTITIPDLRGNVPVGKDSGTFGTLGDTGGSETHTLAESELPAHTHTVQESDDSVGQAGFLNGGSNAAGTVTTSNGSGGGGAHNNLQPWISLNYIIKL